MFEAEIKVPVDPESPGRALMLLYRRGILWQQVRLDPIPSGSRPQAVIDLNSPFKALADIEATLAIESEVAGVVEVPRGCTEAVVISEAAIVLHRPPHDHISLLIDDQ